MKRLIQALLTVLLALGVSTSILAVPPQMKNCNDASQYPDVYSRLECRQQNIADQLDYTSAEVFHPDTKLGANLKPARRAQLNNASTKADRAALRHDARLFKRQAKAEARGHKGPDLGHLVPLNARRNDDQDSDDICDYEQGDSDAECAAIEFVEANDGFPIPCNPNKKNKGKGKGKGGGNDKFDGLECDRWFESEFGSNEGNSDDIEEAAMDLEASYIATEDTLVEMNMILDDVNGIPEEPAALLDGETEEGCDIPEINTDLNNSVIAMREIHAVTFGAARITTHFVDQTVVTLGFGGDIRVAGAVWDSIAMAANIAYIAVDEAHKLEVGKMQKAIMDCSAKTADAVAELLAEVAALKALMQQEHEAIIVNDDENFAETIRVLNTPHGQRDQHPNPDP